MFFRKKKTAYRQYMSKALKNSIGKSGNTRNTTEYYYLCLNVRTAVNISYLLCNFINFTTLQCAWTFIIRKN